MLHRMCMFHRGFLDCVCVRACVRACVRVCVCMCAKKCYLCNIMKNESVNKPSK